MAILKNRLLKISVNLSIIAVSALMAFFIMETILNYFPAILSKELIAYLPERTRERAKHTHDREEFYLGQRKEDYIIEGYVRRYEPLISRNFSTEDNEIVTVQIDEMGFRNPPGYWSANEKFDIILLGDSFIHGTCLLTIADYLRELSGQTVCSVASTGGAPQQWYLYYKKYAQYKNPKLIIINFYEGNDLQDAIALQDVMEKDRDLLRYYIEPHIEHRGGLNINKSHTFYDKAKVIARKIFPNVYSLLTAFKQIYFPAVGTVTIDNSKEIFGLNDRAPALSEYQDSLRIIENTLDKFMPYVNKGGKMAFSYIPTYASVYGDRLSYRGARHETVMLYKNSYNNQKKLSNRVKIICEKMGIYYIDLTDKLRNAAFKKRLYKGNHFSSYGYEIYSRYLYEELAKLKLIN